jgi:hypothetical protein
MKVGPVFITDFSVKSELRGALEITSFPRKSVVETGPIFITDFSVKSELWGALEITSFPRKSGCGVLSKSPVFHVNL